MRAQIIRHFVQDLGLHQLPAWLLGHPRGSPLPAAHLHCGDVDSVLVCFTGAVEIGRFEVLAMQVFWKGTDECGRTGTGVSLR